MQRSWSAGRRSAVAPICRTSRDTSPSNSAASGPFLTYRARSVIQGGTVNATTEPIDATATREQPAVGSTSSPCPICSAEGDFDCLQPREMMMGTREAFPYRHCGSCGSVSVAYDPSQVDLSDYYPDGYYAFRAEGIGSLKHLIRRLRDGGYFGRRGPLTRVVERTRPDPVLANLARVGVTKDHRILDVGCGSGLLVDRLAAAGFSSVQGIDPYLTAASVTPNGAALRPAEIGDIEGQFDVIMFHHVLEHVANPRETLRSAVARLSPEGMCVVRTPTPSSQAYADYGANWVQIDPPRHIAIPSRSGLGILAEAAGLRVVDLVDDSTAFSFWGSEMVAKDIPFDPQAPDYRDPASLFTASELRLFADRAAACNADGTGDQFMATMVAIP